MASVTSTTGPRLALDGLRGSKGLVVSGFAVLLVSVACEFAGPLLIRDYVDRATGGHADAGALFSTATWYLAVAVVGILASLAMGYFAAQSGWRVADRLRVRLLRHVLGGRVLDLESRPPGEVLETVEGNADIIGKSIAEAGFRMIGNLLMVAGMIAIIFAVVPAAGLGVTLLVVLVAIVLVKLTHRSIGLWKTARAMKAELFGFIGDGLAARDDLLPLGASRWPGTRARGSLENLLVAERKAYVGGRAFWPLTQLFFAVSLGIGFAVGLNMLGVQQISIGGLTLIYLYVDRVRGPLEELSAQVDQMQRLFAALGVAANVLSTPSLHQETTTSAPSLLPAGGARGVAFTDVTFSYDDGPPALRNVTFDVPSGEVLGVVGRTGSGKTTMVNLLCGLASPDEGRVTLDGVDVHELAPHELARHVVVLSQRSHLFTATVRDNITLFDDALPDSVLWTTLSDLGIEQWVRSLPEGLDTVVGTGGQTVSAGQAQLIVGARALVRPSGLLIIDEGTSRLDEETSRRWSALIERARTDRTVIMIAHRLETLRYADSLLVLAQGQVRDRIGRAEVPSYLDAQSARSWMDDLVEPMRGA
ncbi:ATP-binding cassette, subfamily B [Kibdelosporangium aridum]|uniref:ATP-binding cassette, subfamily B n=1 Tax=Kibdelosporangium aridum TaxID=2030 RepID=A0A1Y5Y9W7_KIBAR|nr:ATP-binding cassette, subfamily B [Kibdelosporangium aridum]